MVKAIVFLVTTLLNIGIGAALFFILIISLNGFSESESTPGLILFIVWALLSAIIAGFLSYRSAEYLINKKSINAALAGFAAVSIFVVIGAAIDFAGLIVAVLLTSARH